MTPADTSDPFSELIQQMANSANQTSETQQHLLAQIDFLFPRDLATPLKIAFSDACFFFKTPFTNSKSSI